MGDKQRAGVLPPRRRPKGDAARARRADACLRVKHLRRKEDRRLDRIATQPSSCFSLPPFPSPECALQVLSEYIARNRGMRFCPDWPLSFNGCDSCCLLTLCIHHPGILPHGGLADISNQRKQLSAIVDSTYDACTKPDLEVTCGRVSDRREGMGGEGDQRHSCARGQWAAFVDGHGVISVSEASRRLPAHSCNDGLARVATTSRSLPSASWLIRHRWLTFIARRSSESPCIYSSPCHGLRPTASRTPWCAVNPRPSAVPALRVSCPWRASLPVPCSPSHANPLPASLPPPCFPRPSTSSCPSPPPPSIPPPSPSLCPLPPPHVKSPPPPVPPSSMR